MRTTEDNGANRNGRTGAVCLWGLRNPEPADVPRHEAPAPFHQGPGPNPPYYAARTQLSCNRTTRLETEAEARPPAPCAPRLFPAQSRAFPAKNRPRSVLPTAGGAESPTQDHRCRLRDRERHVAANRPRFGRRDVAIENPHPRSGDGLRARSGARSGRTCPEPLPGRGKHRRGLLSLQRRLEIFFVAGNETVFLDDPGAGIPAEKGVVVSGRPNRLGLFEPVHGFAKSIMGVIARAGGALR